MLFKNVWKCCEIPHQYVRSSCTKWKIVNTVILSTIVQVFFAKSVAIKICLQFKSPPPPPISFVIANIALLLQREQWAQCRQNDYTKCPKKCVDKVWQIEASLESFFGGITWLSYCLLLHLNPSSRGSCVLSHVMIILRQPSSLLLIRIWRLHEENGQL